MANLIRGYATTSVGRHSRAEAHRRNLQSSAADRASSQIIAGAEWDQADLHAIGMRDDAVDHFVSACRRAGCDDELAAVRSRFARESR
jgi:hypothetical protein